MSARPFQVGGRGLAAGKFDDERPAGEWFDCPVEGCGFTVGAAGPLDDDEPDYFAEEIEAHRRSHESIVWEDRDGERHELHPAGTDVIYNGSEFMARNYGADFAGESAVITGHDAGDPTTPYEIRFANDSAPGGHVEIMASPDDFWVPSATIEPATPTEPIPTVTLGRRWSNAGHLVTMLGLGLVLGVITGVLAAPVETVEVRTTVTHAAPPVCLYAVNAAGVEQDFRKERDVQAEFARQHTILAIDAQALGDADTALAEQALANAAALARDEAELARIGAEQSYTSHAASCRTWKVPQRGVERVLQ
jgi:hypothetical protein